MRQVIDQFRTKNNDGRPLWCFEVKLATSAWVCLITLLLAGCATPVTIENPCGVIRDSLKDVRGKTPEGDKRISVNFERGVAAGCWKRT